MRIFLSYVVLFFLAKSISVYAQDQCAIALSDAEDKYEQGRLYEVPTIIESCLDDGFTDEERVRAFRLLTLANLFLNYYGKADSTYLQLLKIAPDYMTDSVSDPVELINHSKKFTTDPIYLLTGKIGLNLSKANVLLDHSLTDESNSSHQYTIGTGFVAGIGAEMVIRKDLHLVGEIYYSGKRVRLSDNQLGYYKTTLDISHREVELPVTVKYTFYKGKVNAYGLGGVSPSFIANSLINNIEGYSYDPPDENMVVNEAPLDLPPLVESTTKMKNRFNYNILLGGGISYKHKLNYLVFEVRFSYGMLNVTDLENRNNIGSQRVTRDGTIVKNDFPEGNQSKFPVGYVDDDFKINNLSFVVGYVKPLYKPRKIK